MTTSRRTAVQVLAAIALSPGTLRAQPGGALRMIVGFPPGGVVDVTARATVEGLRAHVPAPIVVENRIGAGGRIAVEALKSSAPDGMTLLYTPPSMFTVFPHIHRNLGYDALADFVAISTVCKYPFALAINARLPARTVAEFLEWARSNPGKAAFGTPGAGTIQHFLGLALSRIAATDFVHVPYKGGAQSIAHVVSGELPASVSVAQLYLPHHRAGTVRVLAVSSDHRLKSLPDVPTFRELGYPELTFEEWFGVFAPARTPEAIVSMLSQAIARAVGTSSVQETLAKLDYAPFVAGPAELSRLVRDENERWRRLVKETGFRAD